ncbi:unnamed protein product [Arabidopsis halleri]
MPKPVFFHGQLYVALSMVTSKKSLKILKRGRFKSKQMLLSKRFSRISIDLTIAFLCDHSLLEGDSLTQN